MPSTFQNIEKKYGYNWFEFLTLRTTPPPRPTQKKKKTGYQGSLQSWKEATSRTRTPLSLVMAKREGKNLPLLGPHTKRQAKSDLNITILKTNTWGSKAYQSFLMPFHRLTHWATSLGVHFPSSSLYISSNTLLSINPSYRIPQNYLHNDYPRKAIIQWHEILHSMMLAYYGTKQRLIIYVRLHYYHACDQPHIYIYIKYIWNI